MLPARGERKNARGLQPTTTLNEAALRRGTESEPVNRKWGIETGIRLRFSFEVRGKRERCGRKDEIMTPNKPVRRVAIIGAGVIGTSWAAQY
jgi:hypothetical protein